MGVETDSECSVVRDAIDALTNCVWDCGGGRPGEETIGSTDVCIGCATRIEEVEESGACAYAKLGAAAAEA